MVLWVKLASWVVRPAAGVVHRAQHVVEVEHGPGRDRLPAHEHPALAELHGGTVLERGEDLGTDVLDEHHPGAREHLGPEAGVAPGDEGRDVDHGGDPALDDRLGAGPVEVDVVDDERRRRDGRAAAPRGVGGRPGRCRRDRRVGGTGPGVKAAS